MGNTPTSPAPPCVMNVDGDGRGYPLGATYMQSSKQKCDPPGTTRMWDGTDSTLLYEWQGNEFGTVCKGEVMCVKADANGTTCDESTRPFCTKPWELPTTTSPGAHTAAAHDTAALGHPTHDTAALGHPTHDTAALAHPTHVTATLTGGKRVGV